MEGEEDVVSLGFDDGLTRSDQFGADDEREDATDEDAPMTSEASLVNATIAAAAVDSLPSSGNGFD